MRINTAPLLKHRGVFASRDPNETRAFMLTKEFELDLAPRDKDAFDFAASAAYLPNSYLGFVRYGAPARVRVPADRKRDDYFIHFPVRGTAEIANAAGSAICAPGQAVVSSPDGHLMRSEQGSSRITVSLTKSALAEHLATLLGDAPGRPLEFAPAIDLASTGGARFSRQVKLVIGDLDGSTAASNPILLRSYEQLIMTGCCFARATRTPICSVASKKCGAARRQARIRLHAKSSRSTDHA